MGLIVFIWCLVVDAGDLEERRRLLYVASLPAQ